MALLRDISATKCSPFPTFGVLSERGKLAIVGEQLGENHSSAPALYILKV